MFRSQPELFCTILEIMCFYSILQYNIVHDVQVEIYISIPQIYI